MQFVFKDEASARTEDYKTPAYDQGKDQAANEAAVIFELNYKREKKQQELLPLIKTGAIMR